MAVPLGPFDLIDQIARGGMGEVWGGLHRESGVEVAVKVITADYALHPGFQASLRQEVRAMASLSHPNIVRVLDQGEIDAAAQEASDHTLVQGSPYIVMERVRGSTLADHVLALDWADVRVVLLKLLAALAHAHARDVLHRDLKPANILLAAGGTTWDLKLTDFGIAHPLHAEELVGPRMAGTPMFMAPEQIEGDWRAYRPATDLFAVGRIATALLARHDDVARVPRGFDVWLARILADVPQERFPLAADAAHALRALGPAEVPLADAWQMPGDAPTVRDFAPMDTGRPAPRASSDLGRFRPPIPDDWREGAEEVKPPLVNAGAGLLGVRQPEVLGRTHERNVLWRLLRRTHDTGRSQIAILRGPEGIGKHALARWLELRAYETGAAWPHRASFDPLESGLDPLARILTRELKTQGLSHEEAEPRVRRLAVLYGQTDPYDIDALLEAANPKDADAPGFRFGAREERLRLLARFLHWAGNERPTLVVLQDVQWSLSAFELLDTFLDLETHAPVPVLFVLTVQEQALATCFREREALDRLARRAGNRCIELPVPPLPGRDHKALIASLVGLDPQVVTRLAQETEGNPLLAIQRVTALHEEGRLEPGPRGLVPRPAGEEARTVASIWRHRLETFLDERSPNSRISVELLAVLGRSVTHEDWLRLCRRAGVNPSQHLVDGLVGAGLLTVEGDTYAFTHHTLRHAVLDLAEREGRLTAHHANAADLLLRHARGVDRHGRIGEHLLLAGRPGLALEHLEKGAESAFVEGQTQRARELIDRWQGALRGLHLPRNDPRQGNGLELEARLALAANEPQPATRAAKRLLRKAIAHGWERHRTTALLLLGWAAYAAGSHDDAVRQLEEALGRVEPTDLPLKSTILFNLARTFAHWGDLDASMRYTAEARTAYLEAHDRRGEALCMLLAANAAFLSGRPDEALTLANTARALSAERGSLGEQAEAVVMAGEIHRSSGDLEKAAEAYKLALRMLRVSGGAVRTAIIELNLGTTSSLRGEHHAAQEMLIGAVQRLHHAGRAGLEAVGHCMLLPSLAATRNQVAYVRHLEAATRLLESARFRESDAIEALERGGRFAMEAGWVELAARTGALAVRMEGW